MANHKHRDIRYKGFIIGLDYLADEGGWVYGIQNEATTMEHGGSADRMPFRDAMRDAKSTIDDIIAEVEDYQEEVAEFAGNDEDYLREDEDPCAEE